MRMKRIVVMGIVLSVILSLSGCNQKDEDTKDADVKESKIQIGLSFDSYVIERWTRDREVFVSTAQDLGAEVNVQNANGEIEKQISQIEYLIDKHMDVIVIVAVDSEALSDVVRKAKEAGIEIVAYDRLIRNADVNLYISFDNEQVGRLMGQALADRVPDGGNIVTIFGPTSDHNVVMMEQGFQDAMKGHNLNVIYSRTAKGWVAEEAYDAMNEAFIKTKDIDGVLCGNDNLATQAVLALAEKRMAGEVVVTGQDADLAACQRIVEGTQTMTVYKPVDKLAKAAAEYAVKLAKDEDISVSETIDDGKYAVPYVKLKPIAVTKDNIRKEIIDGGFQKEEDVYLNVPTGVTE
jgi:D-xylose transport system substrate-binding protein